MRATEEEEGFSLPQLRLDALHYLAGCTFAIPSIEPQVSVVRSSMLIR